MRNISEVATLVDSQAAWTFCIPSRAETVTEGLEESLSIYDDIYNISDCFVLPVESTVTILENIPNEVSLDQIMDIAMKEDRITERTEKVRDSNGITKGHLRGLLSQDIQQTFLTSIQTDRSRVRCRLADRDVYVDEERNSATYRGDTRLDTGSPAYPILKFNMFYVKNPSIDSVESDVIVYVSISTWTDIWFEKTEVGRVNRDRLRGLLERINQALPVVKVNRESTRWEEEMSEIF